MPHVVTIDADPRVVFKLPYALPELRGRILAMLDASGLPDCRVELAIVDDTAIAALNWKALDCRGPTNILSFPVGDVSRLADGRRGNASPPPLLGSLALSADTLLRECFLYGQEPEEHCLRLLAHGLAHLMGLDHGAAMDSLCARLERAGLA
jgi:probable rRNA maturation factor